MGKKIFTGIVTVAIVIMIVCISLVMGIVYDYLGTLIDIELKDEALLVEAALEENGDEYLDKLSSNMGLKGRITIVEPDGTVFYDTKANENEMANHLQREEVQEALEHGEGYAVRESETMANTTRYYALLLESGNILRVSTSHFSHMGLLMDTSGLILAISVILLIICVAISRFVSIHIVKPINDIDLNNLVINEGYEEIAPLLQRIHQQNLKISKNIEVLRRQKDEFEIITNNMSEGLLIVDRHNEVLTYNEAALEILGGEAVKEEGPINVFSLNKSEPFKKLVEETLDGHHSLRNITIGLNTYEMVGNPVYKNGEVTGAIIVIMDITEKQVGERLRREFTSNVSHELKTPLTSIYGVSDMIASGIVKPEDIGHFALTIKEESSRLISLIDDIMKISRMDEGGEMIQKEKIDLAVIVRDVTTRLETKCAEKNLHLRLKCEEVYVNGVEYILDEIVYNLCENAIKYNKDGGTVSVSCTKELGDVILRVADTGIGIPRDELDRVFERFYRVDKSHNKDIPGTGLGLSIVKHGVAFHDGQVTLDSSEGIGTTVVVRFPAVS